MVFISGVVSAQTGTNSPYSISALGELKFAGFTQHKAAGGTSRAQVSDNSFSPINPATYANIDFTIFNAGLYTNFGQLQTSDGSANTQSGNFSNFAMAFPFSTNKKMGVSFGTYQYSDVGYDIKNTVNTDTPSYYNLFKGSGGINKVYVGYGIEAFKNFTIGANANFNFGSIQSATAKVYPNTDKFFSQSDETYFAYSGFDFDLGVQYSVQTKNLKHTLGATYHTQADLKGDGYRYVETFFGRKFNQGSLTPIDTILFDDNLVNNVVKPAGFGVAYSVKNGDKWSVSAEMEQNKWSGVTNKLNGKNFFNNVKYAFGATFVPVPKYEDDNNTYFKKVKYYIGGRYENLYYNFFNQQLNEVGISFGLGLPIIKEARTEEKKIPVVNRVNILFEYVSRGTTDNELIKEGYFNIGVGLNMNDKWFTKRKYR